MKRPILTRERLEARESELRHNTHLKSPDTGAIDGALHLVGKASFSETELTELRDRLHAARVSHDLPKLDPRTNPVLAEGESLPSIPSFNETLKALKYTLFAKKDAIIAENRIAIRRTRGFAKARKAIKNLLRDHAAGARRALEAMAKGDPAPSWILRSVAVATKSS